MEYVLLRYRQRPDDVVGVMSTTDPSEAVELALRWFRESPDEGVIVAVADRPFVHCAPRCR